MSGHTLPETPVPQAKKICEYCDHEIPANDEERATSVGQDLRSRMCWCGTIYESQETRLLRKVLDRLGKMGEDIRRVEGKIDQLRKEERIMANSVAALQQAVTALQAAVTAEDTGIAAIIAALQAASPTGDNPAIDTVVTQLTGLQTDITNQTNAISAAVTPPAAPQTPSEAGSPTPS